MGPASIDATAARRLAKTASVKGDMPLPLLLVLVLPLLLPTFPLISGTHPRREVSAIKGVIFVLLRAALVRAGV